MFRVFVHCMCSYNVKSLVYPRLPVQLKAFRHVVVVVIFQVHTRPALQRIVMKVSLVCQNQMIRFLVGSLLSPMMVLVH